MSCLLQNWFHHCYNTVNISDIFTFSYRLISKLVHTFAYRGNVLARWNLSFTTILWFPLFWSVMIGGSFKCKRLYRWIKLYGHKWKVFVNERFHCSLSGPPDSAGTFILRSTAGLSYFLPRLQSFLFWKDQQCPISGITAHSHFYFCRSSKMHGALEYIIQFALQWDVNKGDNFIVLSRD